MVEIKGINKHYEVYKDGEFWCSADTRHEAEQDKEEAEKEDGGVKFKMKKPLWEISGYKLTTLFIEADSFDAALKIARETDNGYCCGRPIIIRNSNKDNKPNG